jgi:hypothetical protein
MCKGEDLTQMTSEAGTFMYQARQTIDGSINRWMNQWRD